MIKPILFSTPMVQAILAGNKMQTRRMIKIMDSLNLVELEKDPVVVDERKSSGERIKCGLHAIFEDWESNLYAEKAKYQPGDILWVRETWTRFCINKNTCRNALLAHSDYCYKASKDNHVIYGCCDHVGGCKWKPSIFMPKEAARIFLRVTDVRVERVQDISQLDVVAEGIEYPKTMFGNEWVPDYLTREYQKLWDRLNEKRGYGWHTNPWVWVYTFERCEKPEGWPG